MKKFLIAMALVAMSGLARATDTVVVVFDASGSMDENIPVKDGKELEKMKVAKLALAKSLLGIPKGTNVGVLVFSASNLDTNQEWVYPIGPVDKTKLAAAIQLPLPGGGTPLGEYIKKGADALLAEREKNRGYGNYTLVVVTDGIASDGGLVETYVPLVMARGIKLNVIGLAIRADDFLAERSTSYQSADDVDSLATAVSKAVAEIPSDKDGRVDASWFAEIEPIPTELARASLAALNSTITQNQPIGEQPKVVMVVDDQGKVTQVANAQVPDEGMGFFVWIGVLFVGAIILAFVVTIVKNVIG